MCLSIPARIVAITQGEMPMARVDVAGRAESCCLSYVPDAAVDDYVLVQHGFAVERLDPKAAAESLAAFAALGLVPEPIDGPSIDGPSIEPSPAPEAEGLGQVRYAQAVGTGPAPGVVPGQG
ncbi:MAG: HypC/HybG/HupF family hydrogenase formation chaperone [Cellulomonas sp.]|jgi:hydrogenase expression/formation protein HypC|nr:HypC/HybG/HupF family hydrogenase formation chaperone [Cellulomonas sp.]